jgi:hypothetical protein
MTKKNTVWQMLDHAWEVEDRIRGSNPKKQERWGCLLPLKSGYREIRSESKHF